MTAGDETARRGAGARTPGDAERLEGGLAVVAVAAIVVGGCAAEPDVPLDASWWVQAPAFLAIRSDPAEAAPGESVELSTLFVDPDAGDPGAVQFAYCTRPRASTELTAVSADCLGGDDLRDVSARTQVLADACARFGPNPPPTRGEAPPQRPADPDPSGGYYLPIRAAAVDLVDPPAVAFGFQRLRCDLPGATRAIFEAYQAAYTPNEPPEPPRLTVDGERSPAQADGANVWTVTAGETYALRASVPGSVAEPYVVYDLESGELRSRVESLTVRWYVTDGRLDRARELRRSVDASTPAPERVGFDNRWRAPSESTEIHGWIVLTDDRRGVDWSAFTLHVRTD